MSSPAFTNNLFLTPQALTNSSVLSAAFSNALSNAETNPDILSNELRALSTVLDGDGLNGQNRLAVLLERHGASGLAAHREEFVQALQELPTTNLQEASKKLAPLMAAHSAVMAQRFLPSKDALELARSVLSPLHSRISSLPESAVAEVQTRLLGQWQEWEGKSKLSSGVQELILALLPHYARVALAHLGRETPEYLPYLNEIFFKAIAEYQVAEGKEWSQENRGVLIKFLSSQPGRLGTETFSKKAPSQVIVPPNLSGDETRQMMGANEELWEKFLREQIQKLSVSPFESAQVYQRSLSLMHFYVSYLKSKLNGTGFAELPFDAEIYQRVLKDTQNHPYPSQSREIFESFFREILGKEINAETQPVQNPQAYEAKPLPSFVPRYETVQPGELWSQFLRRLQPNSTEASEITVAQLNEADLGVAGTTIFNWGSVEKEGHLVPPGDILISLGVKFFLNALGEVGVDPLDASRLMSPEQLADFVPNQDGEIVIRYSALLKGLSYERFRIGALLQAYLRTRPEAQDMDLAAQWGVSLTTVGAYRRGEYHKMQRETWEKLAKSLSTDESQEKETKKLLMFLRYRPELDAIISIYDQNGDPLNKTPPQASKYRIRLLPDDAELRPLDTTRRIQFEKEPFASALNGTVDFALDILQRRWLEGEILGEDKLSGSQDLSLEEFRKQIQSFRDAHIQHFQVLAQHGHTPGLIQPGQLKQVQDFYRSFFKFFEAIYLHARAKGQITVGAEKVEFEIVPPTLEHLHGVRWVEEANQGLRAYVVAQDVFQNGSLLDPETQRGVIQLRVLKAFLENKNRLLPGDVNQESNRQVLLKTLETIGFQGNASQVFENFERLEKEAQTSKQVLLDPKTEAILHRITRGRLSQGNGERRQFHWEQDLHRFLIRKQIASLDAPMRQVFQAYIAMVPYPFRGFEPQRFEEALAPLIAQQGKNNGDKIKASLFQFMTTLGLPTRPSTSSSNGMTIDGFANAALATYIARVRAEHPLRSQGTLFVDPDILQRVIEDRLIDFPHLKAHEEELKIRLQVLINEYNRREPLIKIYQIAEAESIQAEPFSSGILKQSFEKLAEQYPKAQLHQRLLYATLGELKELLVQGSPPFGKGGSRGILWKNSLLKNPPYPPFPKGGDVAEVIQKALENSLLQLQKLGITESIDLPLNLRFLEAWVLVLHEALQSASRLAAEIPAFVQTKKYHSELMDAQKVGEDIANLFQLYTRSVLLDANPLSLREATLRILGNRFDAYPMLREDVVRGIRVIFHEVLQNFRKQYEHLTENFEFSFEEAKAGNDEEKFWKVFLELSSSPEIPDRKRLEQKILDLEKLKEWTQVSTGIKLFEQFSQAVLELNAAKTAEPTEEPKPVAETEPAQAQTSESPLPSNVTAASSVTSPDKAAIFATPVSAEIMAKFPELDLAGNAAEEVFEEFAGLGWDWALPEGRTLLQILALIRTQKDMETTAAAQAILMEVQGAVATDSLLDVYGKVLALYESHHEELMETIIPFLRLILLPEIGTIDLFIKKEDPIVIYRKSTAALWDILTQRFFSDVMLEEFLEAFESDIKEKEVINIPRFYLKNRDKILQTPTVSVEQSHSSPPINPHAPPAALVARLEREAAELNALELVNSNPAAFYNRPEFYLYKRANAVLSTSQLSPEKAVQKAVRLGSLVDVMEKLVTRKDSFAAWATHYMMKIHSSYRPNILKKIVELLGPEAVLLVFPEIRDQTIESIPVAPGIDIRIPIMPDFDTTAKVFKAMESAWAVPRHRKALEKILWGFRPAELLNSQSERVIDELERISKQLLQYYLENRDELLRAKEEGSRVTPAGADGLHQRYLEGLWELIPDRVPESLKKNSTLAAAIGRRQVEWGQGGEMILAFAEGSPRSLARASLEEFEKVKHQKRGFFQLSAYPGEQFSVATLIKSEQIHPLTLLSNFLPNRLAADLACLYFFLRTQTVERFSSFGELEKKSSYLLAMGVNPKWVEDMLGNELMKFYQSRRESILKNTEFTEVVMKLPELKNFPDALIETTKPLVASAGMEMLDGSQDSHRMLNALPFLMLLSEKPADVHARYFGLIGKLQKQGVDLDVLAEKSARFYLENRKKMLPYLERGVIRDQIVTEASAYTEIVSSDEYNRYLGFRLDSHKQRRAPLGLGDIYFRLVTRLKGEEVPERVKAEYELWNLALLHSYYFLRSKSGFLKIIDSSLKNEEQSVADSTNLLDRESLLKLIPNYPELARISQTEVIEAASKIGMTREQARQWISEDPVHEINIKISLLLKNKQSEIMGALPDNRDFFESVMETLLPGSVAWYRSLLKIYQKQAEEKDK